MKKVTFYYKKLFVIQKIIKFSTLFLTFMLYILFVPKYHISAGSKTYYSHS